MVITEIGNLLSQKIGLDEKLINSQKLSRAIESRQKLCNTTELGAYLKLLTTSKAELEELIEQLIVPETWFFRDRQPFDYLKNQINTESLPSNRRQELLSLPCSTGEEPYSMAIALLEAGLSPTRFAIDAIDISHQSIAKAKRGIYTKNSFRGEEWIDRNRYWKETTEGFQLRESVCSLVNFQQGNAIALPVGMYKKYDIIFCRNLLIYLQPEACSQVLQAINNLLVPSGLLFVGASETGKIDYSKYTSLRQPFTFAFRKLTMPIHQSRILPQAPMEQRKVTHSHPEALKGTPARSPDKQQTIPELPPDLQSVRKLADEGQLAEATARCKIYLNHDRTSVEAYILMGQINLAAQQDTQAEQCFEKALYLKPDSYLALVHLALLKQHQGNREGANIIQQRIGRLQHILESGGH